MADMKFIKYTMNMKNSREYKFKMEEVFGSPNMNNGEVEGFYDKKDNYERRQFLNEIEEYKYAFVAYQNAESPNADEILEEMLKMDFVKFYDTIEKISETEKVIKGVVR